jgi:hypothetical protein
MVLLQIRRVMLLVIYRPFPIERGCFFHDSGPRVSGGRVATPISIRAVRVGVKQQLHFLAAPKERDGLSFNRNQRPGTRISCSSTFPELYKKDSKPTQFDPVTPGHCGGNLRKDSIDDLLGVLPIEMRVLDRYPINEFRFNHGATLGCSKVARIGGPVKRLPYFTEPMRALLD